jgi:hypothetical protein
VLPICFGFAGARCIKTYDINRHLNATWTARALADLEPHMEAIAALCTAPPAETRDR